jgi:cysteine-rich repeat protein
MLDASSDVPTDLGASDVADAAPQPDASMDVTQPDTEVPDAEVPDAEVPDAEAPDAMLPDSVSPDAEAPDAMLPDSGTPDSGTPDSGTPDSGTPDSGTPDSGTPDSGNADGGPSDSLCPGVITVLNCASGTVLGDTAGRPNSYQDYTCGGPVGIYAGSDSVYVFQNPTAAEVTIVANRGRSGGDYDLMVLDGSGACDRTNTCVTASRGVTETETVRFGAAAGQRFYVAYDIYNNPSDTTDFSLQITCIPVVCGDGILAATEECDDGNMVDGDGCSSSCRVETIPIPAPGSSVVFNGQLRSSDPTWGRPFAGCTSRTGSGMHYRTYTLRNAGPAARTVTVTATWSGDGFLFAYDPPFDPTMPVTRCVVGNDDDGDTLRSRLASLTIGPGQERVIVATEFGANEALGPYQITIATDP